MKNLTKLIQEHFNNNMAGKPLFRVALSGASIWDIYLESFSPENNPKFRDPQSSEKNCNHCNNFIRRYGNLVALDDDFNLISLFDVTCSEEYQASMDAMSEKIKSSSISNVFVETFNMLNSLPYDKSIKKTDKEFKLGVEVNHKQYTKKEAELYGVVKEGEIKAFNHFCLTIPDLYVDTTGASTESLQSTKRTNKEVFMRGMEEITLDVYNLVIDLINQGSLLHAASQLEKIKVMCKYKKAYNELPSSQKDNWCWIKSQECAFPKFRNELIGVLHVELSQGEDLNKAVLNWNKRVDPSNYMKAVAPITKAQVAQAKKFIEDNDYEDSFQRRYATLDDIRVTEILHVAEEGEAKKASIFDSVPTKKSSRSRSKFDDVQNVSIQDFLKNILPTATSVEAYLENRYVGNMMTLTTSKEGVKNIHAYNNPYSMTFNGNLAGKSELAKMVEAKGGRTDGAFRFTHSWNKLERNQSLMDLHVFMPGCKVPTKGGGPHVVGRRVGWNKRQDPLSNGVQDVDYTDAAPQGYVPVENITFPDVSKMPEGDYTCCIHNWSFRNTGGKGEAELAIGGEIYQYIYPASKNHQWIKVATATLKNGEFTIKHHLPHTDQQKEIYGLTSKEFHKVNLICNSPNHWDKPTGNLYYLFLLENAANPNPVRSFHNVDLVSELKAQRKVLDVLGSQCLLEPTSAKNQLSGLGFNSTVRDNLVVRVKGTHNRIINITF